MLGGFFKRFFGTKGFTKIITNQAVTVTLPNRSRPFTMASDHRLFPALVEALNAKNEEAVLGIVAVVEQVTKYGEGNIEVKNGQVFYKGEVVHNVVADRILQFIAEGVPCSYLFKFLEKVLLNPLESARKELFLFLENGQLPIMTDGRFQAYKWVNNELKDCHTGSFNNAPGQIVEMPRERVDTDRHRTCSSGLHVCTQNYMKFGDRLVLVAVDPADVMAVPTDYKEAKMRVCRYEVLEEIKSGDYGNRKHAGIVQYKPALTEAERRRQAEISTDLQAEDEHNAQTFTDEDEAPSVAEGVQLAHDLAAGPGPDEEGTDVPKIPTGNFQVRFVGQVDLIPAIRALRTAYDMGLKEAKDIVDNSSKTFLQGISEDAADKIKKHMKENGVSIRVEEMGARKKVAKSTKPAKSKAVKKPSKKEKPAMDDATWVKFKKAVKNKKSVASFGLSPEETKKLRKKAKEELDGQK